MLSIIKITILMTKIIKMSGFKTDQWIDCPITYRWVSFAILHS